MTSVSRLRADGGALRRFVAPKADPERSRGLPPDHPAVLESRTLFPGNVRGVFASPRFLVDGKNNAKIGGKVLKGPWAGMPVYTLTLEERATCPRSCAQWLTCYGNAMQWPRRNDARDPDFIPALAAEVITVARENPEGFVVRLHVLGDFWSVPYVRMWAHLLDMLPMLHVYGYTARREDDEDEETRSIAKALAALTETQWERFAIRTSHTSAGRQRTIVVTEPSEEPGVIMCPAQTEKTETCGTCALCWSEGARDKTIAFLLHGIKRGGKMPEPFAPLTVTEARASIPEEIVEKVKKAKKRGVRKREETHSYSNVVARKPKEPEPDEDDEPEEPALAPLRPDEPAYITRARARLAPFDAAAARVLSQRSRR